ncbi:MAG: family 20 glycosylhydrolase [Limisphaerales bacterium]
MMRLSIETRASLAAAAVSLAVLLPSAMAGETARPALLPLPRQIEWSGALFDARRFEITAPPEAGFAAAELERILMELGGTRDPEGARITLRLGETRFASPESYSLEVAADHVTAAAPQPVGLLYAVQTLRQLATAPSGRPVIAGCRLTDAPAFAWRGFMHDVGRNFQDIELLKRFVEVMARYKLNVFHFHLTDHPAWRIECRVHPELNDPKFTPATRNPGKFYTYAELNDFIAFCRDRGVRVVPEIDMPGHSDYFKRAFGVDMQDARGMEILAACLNEFLHHVDTPELHIGSDEATIRNPNFLPRMTELVRSRGRQIIVWRPGHLPEGKVITQLWSAGDLPNHPLPGIPALDSRNDYVNHMDPFDGPLRILNLATCGQAEGDEFALGGILCHWPDIAAGEPMNIYRQSPVLPALLAAAERYWRGHTPEQPKYWARLPDAGTPDFARYAEFEARMVEQRDRFLTNWPFPYVKQTDVVWKLIGPFDHRGDVNAVFPVERELREEYVVNGRTNRWLEARGATIHFNHFWYDGWLPKTKSGTAYALTHLWSPRAQTVDFWIGFNGPSRSDRRQGANPQQGQWSTAGSRIWVNDSEIPPPRWKQPGALRQPLETPFVDEDYFYRTPTRVALQPGWNRILVKAPRSEKTWKWMFTCVPVTVNGNAVREVEGLRFAARPE